MRELAEGFSGCPATAPSPYDIPMIRRRIALLSIPALAGCGGREPPGPPLPAIAYRHLTPLALNVATVAVAPDPPWTGDDPTIPASPRPADAVRIMGRDRLTAVGTAGEARFAITRASLRRAGGLACLVGCRLEIYGAENDRLAFIEAEARASATGTEAERSDAPDRLLRRAMADLNVEFEFQMRRNLRAWLVLVPPGSVGAVPAPAPGSIAREDLPRS